jgi:hypothetical protein
MCLRISESQWKVADVRWEEVLVLGVRVDEREAGEIYTLDEFVVIRIQE